MPTRWFIRLQRWCLHPLTCPEYAWGHPHNYGGCPKLSPSVTTMRALFRCPVAHRKSGTCCIFYIDRRSQTKSRNVRETTEAGPLSQGSCKAGWWLHHRCRGGFSNPNAHSQLKRINPWSDQDRKQKVSPSQSRRTVLPRNPGVAKSRCPPWTLCRSITGVWSAQTQGVRGDFNPIGLETQAPNSKSRSWPPSIMFKYTE